MTVRKWIVISISALSLLLVSAGCQEQTQSKSKPFKVKAGAKAPAGAVILFDGSDLSGWRNFNSFPGLIDITSYITTDKSSVAYLSSQLWSDESQQAVLEVGSDDGVKIWLNGEVVHANNALRGHKACEDKVAVQLEKGWNILLVKVTQGGGGWGFSARLVDKDNNLLKNISEKNPIDAGSKGTRQYLDACEGFLTLWAMSGPYSAEGKGPEQLFDIEFSPEKGNEKSSWQAIGVQEPDAAARWNIVDGAMEVNPGTGSIITKKKFTDFKLHIEFKTPYMPDAKGQARGNSGVYLQGRYEIQVLDSFGLDSQDNDCGGIYQVAKPIVNACFEPDKWQSYDITFYAPKFDASGNKIKDAVVTVYQNGVLIHDNVSIPAPTGGAKDYNIDQPGGIYLQDHGNKVQFRNIWLVEL